MDIVFVILLILLVNTYLIKALSNNFNIASENYLWGLFTMHFLMNIAYMGYTLFSNSDSVAYYNKTQEAESWLSVFGTGTTFIHFLAYPFVVLFSLSYYATMIVFAYIGYLAIVVFYLSARENIKLEPVAYNLSYIELIFLLPNIHFWSSSLGKGSSIMIGLALFTFGLSRFNRRIPALIIGSLITFLIRPHIFFTLVVSIVIGLLITRGGIKGYLKWLIIMFALVVFVYISDDVMRFANTESLDITNSSALAHRASELSKSDTGVKLQEYNIFMKMFTFWFRPLFVDGQGAFGFIVSFENLAYLFMFVATIREAFLSWSKWNGWFRILVFAFLLGSFILAQVTGNLGIAMRQKAQFMPFFFIIFCKAMSYRRSFQVNRPIRNTTNQYVS
jgi:hypothetical protein